MTLSLIGTLARWIFWGHPSFIGVAQIPSDGDGPIRYLILAASARRVESAREELHDRFYDYFNERGLLDSTPPYTSPRFSHSQFGPGLHVTSLLRGEQRVVAQEKLERFLEDECFGAPVFLYSRAGKGVDVIIVKPRSGKRPTHGTDGWRNITPPR